MEFFTGRRFLNRYCPPYEIYSSSFATHATVIKKKKEEKEKRSLYNSFEAAFDASISLLQIYFLVVLIFIFD